MSQHLPPRRQNWKPIKTRDGPHRAKKCRLRWGAIDGERNLQQTDAGLSHARTVASPAGKSPRMANQMRQDTRGHFTSSAAHR
jgi:hypothetical protein